MEKGKILELLKTLTLPPLMEDQIRKIIREELNSINTVSVKEIRLPKDSIRR